MARESSVVTNFSTFLQLYKAIASAILNWARFIHKKNYIKFQHSPFNFLSVQSILILQQIIFIISDSSSFEESPLKFKKSYIFSLLLISEFSLPYSTSSSSSSTSVISKLLQTTTRSYNNIESTTTSVFFSAPSTQ